MSRLADKKTQLEAAYKKLTAAREKYITSPTAQNVQAYYDAQIGFINARSAFDTEQLHKIYDNPQQTDWTFLTQLTQRLNRQTQGQTVDIGDSIAAAKQIIALAATGNRTDIPQWMLQQAVDAANAYLANVADHQNADDLELRQKLQSLGVNPTGDQFNKAGLFSDKSNEYQHTPTTVSGVPDGGVTPQFTDPNRVPDEGVRPTMTQPGVSNKKGMSSKTFSQQATQGIYIQAPEAYAPLEVQTEYNQAYAQPTEPQDESTSASGILAVQGQSPAPGTADSVDLVDQKLRNLSRTQQTGVFQGGYRYANSPALRSDSLVFTGYQTNQQKRVYDDGTVERVSYKTPSYAAANSLVFALGQPGFPTIAEYQKSMGLVVTGVMDPDTRQSWQNTLGFAAMNTSQGIKMTVQDAMRYQNYIAAAQLRAQRAAMAASYSVDPTASAAILGSSAKRLLGRLSTAQEDSEFHSAFNQANISTQGKVDAQQFALDWLRKKYPTEAGTMMAQDYYGAMYDVLTSGPGSLGSEAANVNG